MLRKHNPVLSNKNIKDYYHLYFQNTKIVSQLSTNFYGVALDTHLSLGIRNGSNG